MHREIYIKEMEAKLHAKLDPSKLLELMTTTKTKLSQDMCFPENYRQLFDTLTFTGDEAKLLLQIIKDPVMQFNGDIEKFYIKFHEVSSSTTNTFLSQKIGRIPTNIFFSELQTLILRHITEPNSSDDTNNEVKPISERELFGLQYIGGHVAHKLYLKFRLDKKFHENKRLQYFGAFLKSCKVDDECERLRQRLIALRDRGGLWMVCRELENIFVETEKEFRVATKDFITKIDDKTIVKKVLIIPTVVTNSQKLCDKIDTNDTDDTWKVKLMKMVIGLYVRIRAHSYAKDIRELHKWKKHENRKRSLRNHMKLNEKEIYKKLDKKQKTSESDKK